MILQKKTIYTHNHRHKVIIIALEQLLEPSLEQLLEQAFEYL